jgi:hypothetical protein
MNSTNIPYSKRSILGCLLVGIGLIAGNLGLFFWAQIQGALEGTDILNFVKDFYASSPATIHIILVFDVLMLFLWPTAFCFFVHKHDPQLIGLIKQMIVGWAVLLIFISLIASLVLIALFDDGRLGSIATFITALLCTPFTMEFLLLVIGAILVIVLNSIRIQLSEDEYVELEIEVDDTK